MHLLSGGLFALGDTESKKEDSTPRGVARVDGNSFGLYGHYNFDLRVEARAETTSIGPKRV